MTITEQEIMSALPGAFALMAEEEGDVRYADALRAIDRLRVMVLDLEEEVCVLKDEGADMDAQISDLCSEMQTREVRLGLVGEVLDEMSETDLSDDQKALLSRAEELVELALHSA